MEAAKAPGGEGAQCLSQSHGKSEAMTDQARPPDSCPVLFLSGWMAEASVQPAA